MTNNINFRNKVAKAYEILSRVSVEAYKDYFLLSNQVLSKNPYTNKFLNNYLFKKRPKQNSLYNIIMKIIRYYFYSIGSYLLYLIAFVFYTASKTRVIPSKSRDELIIIDKFFLTKDILQKKKFEEKYFPGLAMVLKMLNKNYVYLPSFYALRNPMKVYSLLRILKKDKVPILSAYQLLTIKDISSILRFIVVYPWHVLRFSKRLDKMGCEYSLVRSEILDTIGEVTFLSFAKYLQGKRISDLPYKELKVISWYENQAAQKNLYKGLRSGNNRVRIYGAQLFLYSKTDLNIIPDENEVTHDIVPDRIIVNGPGFIPQSSKLDYVVGPSLRYRNLFREVSAKKSKEHILIMLSYDESDSRNILEIIAASGLRDADLLIKPHPATPTDKFLDHLSPQYRIVHDNIYDLFDVSKIAIGSASGSLIEAASCGIPVIVVNDPKRFKYDILPEYGRGIIWDEANTADELMAVIWKFEKAIDESHREIDIVADNYKKMFFCEPSEEKIIKAFDLGNTY